MLLTPAQRLILHSPYPRAKFLDLKSDVTGLTTYTFTGVNIGPRGTSELRAQSVGTDQIMRSPSNKMVAIIVHTKASAVTWTISSCTLGGVAGGKVVDRGGATNAINTAIFQWNDLALAGITTTDVVVTGSKALLGCAIGVISLENFYLANTSTPASASGTATAATNASTTLNTDSPTLNYGSIVGSTCTTANLAEKPIWGVATSNTNGSFAPTMLYEGGDAVQSYSAAFQVAPGYCANQGAAMRIDWSEAGAFDWAASCIR